MSGALLVPLQARSEAWWRHRGRGLAVPVRQPTSDGFVTVGPATLNLNVIGVVREPDLDLASVVGRSTRWRLAPYAHEQAIVVVPDQGTVVMLVDAIRASVGVDVEHQDSEV